MIHSILTIGVALGLAAQSAVGGESSRKESESQALTAVDRFMSTFNSSDAEAWAASLSYPHVRIASGDVKIWQTPQEYADGFDFEEFKRRTGWHHSAFDYKNVLQSGTDKVHVAVKFTRYRVDGSKIASYEALYIVTKVDGRFGIQARSSFAP